MTTGDRTGRGHAGAPADAAHNSGVAADGGADGCRPQVEFLGGVSAGHTAYWYYDLPPGDYAVSQLTGNGWMESPTYWGVYARVRVQ